MNLVFLIFFLYFNKSSDIEKKREEIKLSAEKIISEISILINDTIKKIEDLDKEIKIHAESFKQAVNHINSIAESFNRSDDEK